MGYIIAITSAFLGAIGNVLLKRASKDLSPFLSFLLLSLFAIFIWIPVSFVIGFEPESLPTGLVYGFISAIMAQAFYIYAITRGELSISAPVVGTYTIYTIIFSTFINNERLAGYDLIFVAFTIIGTLLVSLPQKLNRQDIANSKYIIWPLLAAVSIGFSDAITKNFIDKAGAGTFLLSTAIMQLPVAFVLMKLQGEKVSQLKNIFKEFNSFRIALVSTCFITLHTLTIFLAFGLAPASIISPIIGTIPGITALLALLFLKEKLPRKDIIGIITMGAGVIGISIF